jgi:hypothetical protein
MTTYTGQLKSVIAKYQDAGTLFEGPFVLYKRPKAGDLDVRPYTPNMAEGIKASGAPVFAVFPKKGSGHRDISQLDAYIQAICAEPKHNLVDEQGEPMVKCHRAPNLIASERGSLCVRVNNWSAHHPDKATSGKGDLSWEAKDIYLSYSNVDSGGSKKVKAEATYF